MKPSEERMRDAARGSCALREESTNALKDEKGVESEYY